MHEAEKRPRKRGAAAASRAERDARVFELRKAGDTFEDIGLAVGVTTSCAFKSYRRFIARLPAAKERDELRALEATRIDSLQRAHWKNAVEGDRDAAELILRLIARRARLLGLDAPPEPANLTIILLQQIQRHVAALSDDDLLAILGYDASDFTSERESLPPANS